MTENVVYGKEAMLHLHRMVLSNNSVTWRLGFVEIRKKIVGQKWRENYSHLMWFLAATRLFKFIYLCFIAIRFSGLWFYRDSETFSSLDNETQHNQNEIHCFWLSIIESEGNRNMGEIKKKEEALEWELMP